MTTREEARSNHKDKRKAERLGWVYDDKAPINPEQEKVEETKSVLDEIKSWFKGV
jgi:hypothetical protein